MNLQPLKWSMSEFVDELESNSLTHSYSILADDGAKFKVAYHLLSGGTFTKYATGFATIEDAKTWCWNHYNEKMQPYVKPSPTWISVDDRLPEMYDRVLIRADCTLVAGREPKSEYNKDWGIKGGWMWSIVNDSWCDAHMVTHWMPIPEFSEVTK